MKKRDIIPSLLDAGSYFSALEAIFCYIDWSNHGMYTVEHLIDLAPDNMLYPLFIKLLLTTDSQNTSLITF